MSLTCPVCGYDKINEPKLKWSICPSCGTQFGLSDSGRTWEQLRHDWIYDDGATWQDGYFSPPPYWSPISQFRNIGYNCTIADRRSINGRETVLIGTTTVTNMGEFRIKYVTGNIRISAPAVTNTQTPSVSDSVPGRSAKAGSSLLNSRVSFGGLQVCQNF